MENVADFPASTYPIESVANALKLLLLFRDRPAIRVADAGRYLGVARSTAHRLLAMLAQFGFAVQDPKTRAYHAGPALVAIGSSVTANDDIRSAARPHMEALVSTFGETVHVCTLRGGDIAFLSSVESSKALRVGDRSGTVLPAYATSAGKALLAILGDAAVRERFPDEMLPALTRKTIRTRTALLRELQNVRERGFAINNAESEAGITALGCAIYNRAGEPRGALVMSMPEARFRAADLTRIAAALRNACDAVSSSIR